MSSYLDGSKRFDDNPTWRFVKLYIDELQLILKQMYDHNIVYGREFDAVEKAYKESMNLLMKVEDELIRKDINER
jgi:hypothetical protein